jgi:hypothetical protein
VQSTNEPVDDVAIELNNASRFKGNPKDGQAWHLAALRSGRIPAGCSHSRRLQHACKGSRQYSKAATGRS